MQKSNHFYRLTLNANVVVEYHVKIFSIICIVQQPKTPLSLENINHPRLDWPLLQLFVLVCNR